MKLATTIAALAIFAAPAAWAGSLGETPTEPMMEPMAEAAPAPYDWSGFYAGLSAGKASGDFGSLENGVEYFTNDIDGNSMGLFAGYNFQRGNLVYGLELALQNLDAEFVNFAPGFEVKSAQDLKFRIGYALDNILLYGFAGASRGDWYFADNATEYDQTGTNYGVGVDYAVNDRLLIGIEYIDRALDGDYGEDFSPILTTRTDFSTVQLRVGYKF